MSKHAGALALAIAVVWVSGCGGEELSEAVSTSARPIQGGSDDGTHLFAVGILGQMTRGTALCSGALLAPNLVATARHCVAALPGNGVIACPTTQFGALTPASSIVVTTDADVRTGTTQLAVAKIILPTGADQISVCGHDIALLILSQNVALPAYVTPVLSPPMTDHTVYSTTVTDIGYGISSPTDTAGTSAGIRRIKPDVKLTCISNDTTFTDCLPSMAAQLTAAEFVSGNGTCEGDSGSNAFEQSNFDAGKWVSFGVLSRGGTVGGTCVGGIYSRFDAWSALITGAANQAATMGGYPVPSWAGGQDGGSGSPSRDAGAPPDAMGSPRDSGASPAPDGGVADGGARPGSDGGPRTGPDGTASSGSGDGPPARADGGAAPEGGSSGKGSAQAASGGGCSCATAGTDASGLPRWPAALVGLGLALTAIGARQRRGRR
jgi:hypothetical protein